jgi:hypothetical protein
VPLLLLPRSAVAAGTSPPTLVADYVTSWGTATSPQTGSVTVGVGDQLVVVAGSEDAANTISTPTGGGLTYTLRQSVVVASNSTAYGWTAPSASAQTFTLSATKALAGFWGWDALRFSGSDGIGASSKTNSTGAPSLSITTTQANSAIVVVVTDWNATDGASRVWRTVNGIAPTAGNGFERMYFRNTTNYAAYVAYYPDAGAAGAKTVGLSAPTTTPKYSIVAIEVLGSSSTPPTSVAGLAALALGGTGTVS